MTYRVFDTSISRLIGWYESESEALALVQALIVANGEDYAEDLAVSYAHEDGSYSEPLSGAVLAARANSVTQQQDAAHTRSAVS